LPSGPSSGGDNGSVGNGSGGSIFGAILGAVIRGGIVVGDGDDCDPRTDGHGAVNNRIPGGIRIPVGYPRSGGRMPGRMGSGPRIPRF
jgi:hypothetical protein